MHQAGCARQSCCCGPAVSILHWRPISHGDDLEGAGAGILSGGIEGSTGIVAKKCSAIAMMRRMCFFLLE
jgi:hypothetical protein